MAFTGNFTCNSFKVDLFNGTTDFSSTTTYKIALYTNGQITSTTGLTTSGTIQGNTGNFTGGLITNGQ